MLTLNSPTMLLHVLFPPSCPICGTSLDSAAQFVCEECRRKAPLTHTADKVANPIVRQLWREMHITHACAFLYFAKSPRYRDAIHAFKYRHKWRYAYQFGEWFGAELKASPIYADIDVVVPIPLHPFKIMERGYNQSEYLARGIAKALGVPCITRAVRRTRHNPSQTSKTAEERKQNVKGIFRVAQPKRLAHKHILLVDDVMTSGATIASCGRTILDNTFDTQLSIATLAYAGNDEEPKPKKKE